MARRAHRKSRNGCLECKRRHVKCDERRPICSNCISSERDCEYGSCIVIAPPAVRRPNPRSRSAGPTSTTRLSNSPGVRTDTLTPSSIPSQAPSPFQSQVYTQSPTPGPFSGAGPSTTPQPPEDAPANMLHVTLLQNLLSKTHLTFDPTRSLPWLSTVFGSPVIATPYLINELLAFSALHMSILSTTQKEREYYHYHAAHLQTHALGLFKEGGFYGVSTSESGGEGEAGQDTDSTSAIPLFLFSSVLGVHMLCDTLIYHTNTFNNDNDFESFLSRFTHYLRLHTGVRAVLRSRWSSLTSDTSPLKPALDIGMKVHNPNPPLSAHLSHLLSLILSSSLGPELEGVYKQAIETLQSCADVASAKYKDEGHAGINGLISWPVMVGVPFIETLEDRRPEGLVVLAHYAVLLYEYRGSWVFGGSGGWIIGQVERTLNSRVGEDWEEWLRWPRGVLAGDTQRDQRQDGDMDVDLGSV
ncbi:uncharacterized protein BDV14DRAFT_205311 [Aspergillus stella-maris]|uniref:uncharacterized protein n=1 Tax=Aspergillus stella-maris TaxID=1810926 RepID=UPI003CCCE17E